MDVKNSSSGKIIKTLTGYHSFIPNPLPPTLEWNNELAVSLSKANHVLGMLARESTQLPNPHLLMRPFIAREAVLSSKIEGTSTTLSEMLAKDVDIHIDRHPNDLIEVQNYILALDHGLKPIKELPLSLRLIKEIHAKLMNSVRGEYTTPGEFRRSQNCIGSPGCTLNTAKYVPPIPEELMNCLDSFEKFLYNRMMPSLIHIALCHYQFEAIHPFLDGNGRIGRLLITILLIEHKLLPSPILYLSAFFEATRDEYYKQLYNVSSKGTWNEWLIYFLNGVTVHSLDVLSRAERINALIIKWQIKVGSNHFSNMNLEIIKNLAVTPFCTINNISKKFGVAFTTAQRTINKLEKLGIILQTSTKKRDKIYCATEILNILEEPTKITENLDGTLQT